MALRLFGMAAGLIVCLPGHGLWRMVGARSPWPRLFLGWVGRCAGARARVLGAPRRSHVLFIANHASWLDIMVIAGATGASFVSKEEIRRWPLAGWLADLNHTVYVERTARGAVHGQAGALRASLQSGRPVALFPEGTTDGGTDVLPFRASLLAAVVPPIEGVVVQPVAIDYGSAGSVIAWVGKESAMVNARRVLSRPGSFPVLLRFLDPIDPRTVPDRKTLAKITYDEITQSLGASA
jgi:1-acyl-sn-glycerol-3-phosphate acyltransferase